MQPLTSISCELPAMPFGHASARFFPNEESCGDFLAGLPDAPSRFGALGKPDDFRVRLRSVPLPGVTLVAGSSTPKATDHSSPRLALVIPFGAVETLLRCGREEYRWSAPHHAFFIPVGETIEAESSGGSFLRLDLVEAELLRVAAGMKGCGDARAAASDLARPRIVPLQGAGGLNWLPIIRAVCGVVDAFDCDAARLVEAGIDDLILRTAVMMLHPETCLEAPPTPRTAPGLDLDPLLERIMSSLAERITLAELEAWSGRSARAIQIAFQKRFGISPMRWVSDRRLDLVRTRLLAARPGDTVRGIAASCGCKRMATLIPEYLARFGERPSDTLRRSAR